MDWDTVLSEVCIETPSKIVLFVMDGVGGLPVEGKTELESAQTPHLDKLAKSSVCGLTDPVFMGVTPGSGPAHLALFGYDPTRYLLGRGILEALGIGVSVGEKDLVARGNFATLQGEVVVDRRAGRIPTEENEKLCRKLNEAIHPIQGADISLFPGKEHRFVLKVSGDGLSDSLTDADPQKENKPRTYTTATAKEAEPTAAIINAFLDQATRVLSGTPKANTVLLRGFSKHPSLPTMRRRFKLKPAAIANYPMYKGLAKLVGMKVVPVGQEPEDLVKALEKNISAYDFFYVHYKKTDAAGEDGNFIEKTKAIEEADRIIPRILACHPDVLVVTSDHSTPSVMKGHSWHPNPFLLYARTAFPDSAARFTERECAHGFLGRFPAVYAMPLMLAHAEKMKKFGA